MATKLGRFNNNNVGFALAVAPVIWQNLSDKERVNVENWLGNSINQKKWVLTSITDGQATAHSASVCPTRTGSGSVSLRTWD